MIHDVQVASTQITDKQFINFLLWKKSVQELMVIGSYVLFLAEIWVVEATTSCADMLKKIHSLMEIVPHVDQTSRKQSLCRVHDLSDHVWREND